MKRILVLFLVFMLMLGITACGNAGSDTENDHTEPEETLTFQLGPSEKEEEPEAVSGKETMNAEDVPAHDSENSESEAIDDAFEMKENRDMKMTIGDTVVPVTWEGNESVKALMKLCQNSPLTIQMSMYGGFEQVGSIGQSLPRNDIQITTGAGDIVLYSGNQLVVFYGSNAWAYTRLGHIDLSQQEMSDLLGNGDVTITLE